MMREEKREAGFYPWSPAGQADTDQQHAEALDRLRGAEFWFLVTGNETDGGDSMALEVSAGGKANLVQHAGLLAHTRTEATRMLGTLVRFARGEH